MSVQDLKELLKTLPSGPFDGDVETEVRDLLASFWDAIPGALSTSMAARKLSRAENWRWEPPIVSFVIERHGGTVQGSKLAELQSWFFDVERFVAGWGAAGSRRLQAFSPKLDLSALAAELIALVDKQAGDPRLTWKGIGCVRINVSVVIPDDAAKQTTQGRRKRFRSALIPLMAAAGWRLGTKGTQLVFEKVTNN